MRNVLVVSLLFAAIPLFAQEAPPSPCQYAYWPVASGTQWEYRLETRTTDPILKERKWSQIEVEKIASVGPDGFIVERTYQSSEIGNGKSTKAFSCTPAGLVLDSETSNGTVLRYRGIQLPASPSRGATFDHAVVLDPTQSIPIAHRVIGLEEVTVPAGTFNALRVDYRTVMDAGPDVRIEGNGSKWFAEGRGLVRATFHKVTTVSGKAENVLDSTSELVSFKP
ncbi:MAG TPA: hypothetical protein VIL97_08550 [Thermoanaerobaculia bacterium]